MDSSVHTGSAHRLLDGLKAVVIGSSHRARAGVLFFLALPQFYFLPPGNTDVSLTTVCTVLLLPGIVLGSRAAQSRRFVRSGLFLVLIGLLAIRLVALTWSPDPRSGLQSIVLLGQFVVTVVLMCSALARESGLLKDLQLVYWPWVVIEICLVVLFRLLPGVEEAFLRSVGGVLAGHNSIASFFGSNPNNVTDVAKAGGVFLNANVAAIFLGVNGLSALAISAVTRSRAVRIVGIAALLAVPFTGSKSATILALVLPLAAVGLVKANGMKKLTVRRPWVIAAFAVGLAAILTLSAVSADFVGALKEAFVGRTIIWGFGAEAFLDHPLLGLGYGGWEIGFKQYAAELSLHRGNFPPHNILLAAWAKTGILGLTLTVTFFVLTARLVLRRLSDRAEDPRFVALGGAALAWVMIQGMGENTDVYGEIHLIPILSLLIGYLSLRIGEETKYRGKHANRRHREAPAVPAVGDIHRRSSLDTVQLPAVVRGQEPGTDQTGSGLG